MTFADIVAAIPLWVYPLFLFLMVLGIRASHDRTVPVALIYALPLLGLLSIGTLQLVPSMVTWVLFVACIGIGTWLGLRLQPRYVVRRDGMRVELRGEWVTMFTILTVFGANFAVRFMAEISPEILNAAAMPYIAPVLPGLATGMFLGRALCIWRWGAALR